MRRLMLMFLLMFGVALLCSGDVLAKGGGGGGGRQRVSGGQRGGQQRSVKQERKHERQGGQTRQVADSGEKPDHRKEKPLKEKPAKERKVKESDETTTPEGDDDVTSPDTEVVNKKQKQIEIAQRQRDKRIAQAQHLREIAERNGNVNLADNADRMEAFAHDHYARRIAHWENFGVTDPTLNPDGGTTDPLDPLLPDGDNPLLPDGEEGVLDPVGEVLSSLLPRLP